MEFVVAVVGGSGSSWVVEFLNRGETLAWEMIGDLSDAGSDSDWTKVSVATKSDDPTEWMDADSANTILVRVRSKSTAQVRCTGLCWAASSPTSNGPCRTSTEKNSGNLVFTNLQRFGAFHMVWS